MRLPHRAVHLDFHTMPAIPDVGADFDADAFARTLDEARVDFITVFAKCNLGMAYYPTRVGVVHPSLKRDLLGEMVEACHRRDIGVAAYWNAGLDHEMALRHRDWALLGDDGRVYGENPLDHFFRTMCFAGPYADHLAAMIEEVLEDYEIDGVFLDCWYFGAGCQGGECVDGMREEGMDPTHPAQRVAFQDAKKMDFARRVRGLIDRTRPEATYFLNGIPYDLQRPFVNHIEIESLPCGGWGYDNFPWKVRYLRKRVARDGRPVHVVGQTGRFHRSWGDFGGLRTQDGLDYDCFQAASHAAACGVGDHMHPRGTLSAEAYRRIGRTFRRIEALDEWTRGATALTDTAVVVAFGEEIGVSLTDDHRQVVGATRALAELKRQFDILPVHADWAGYQTLVLLDGVRLDDDGQRKVHAHLAAGGAILSTATGGMLATEDSFPEEWGIACTGEEPCSPHFLRATPDFCTVMPDEVLTVGAPAVALAPEAGTETLAEVIAPYFNRHWDGRHGHVYLPPDKPAGRPGIVRRGRIIHFASAVFSDYAANANPLHRDLVGAALDALAGDGLVAAQGLPSFARLTLTRQEQPKRTIVHLLSYVPELRTRKFTQGAVPGQPASPDDPHQAESLEIIEEPVALRGVRIALRGDGAARVYLAPSGKDIPFRAQEGLVTFDVEEVSGYQMIVIEG